MRIAAANLLLLFAVAFPPAGALAASPKCALAPESALRLNPPKSNRAIQSFDYGPGGNVYFMQPSRNDTRLSRCFRTSAGKCVQRDSVKLPRFGHGESLEVYSKKGRTYAWVGSGARKTPPRYHSRTISLIEYIKAPKGSKKASYRRVGTLTDLASIVPGKSGAAARSAVALSDKQGRLAIRVQLGGPRSAAYYGIYKTAALTALMKKAPGNKLPIAKAKKLMVSQFKEPKTSKKAFQGFDIKGDGAKLKHLYVFRGYVGQTPTIYLYSWRNGGEVAKRGKRVIESKSTAGFEAEGIKVEADPMDTGGVHVQIGFNPTRRDSKDRRIFRLYRLAESASGLKAGAAVLPPCPAADPPSQKVNKHNQGDLSRGSNLLTGELPGAPVPQRDTVDPPEFCEDPLLQKFMWTLVPICSRSGGQNLAPYPLAYYR
ncbi:hypothetical protein [Paeniglutamicibacter kerguelensis]|uniref:Uncharacterized protein n=1 Tax=Paeniglutamicibacter kerguelensis TaxID=254788 RepID=A0ABS4XHD0_9MICC|nr:hypothetical protein [Paeniglutamicibacter kerguelensis]MBP2387716.1 hypothetical protein [Paeniglutamicibacter kerguelensis]